MQSTLKRSDHDGLRKLAEELLTAQKRAKAAKATKATGIALIGLFCPKVDKTVKLPTMVKVDIKAELAEAADKGYFALLTPERRNAAVQALVALTDNVDNSPIVAYTSMKATFGTICPNFPSFAQWVKTVH